MELLYIRMTKHQATGFRAQGIGKRGHERQGTIGLEKTCGMGDMEGVSEGMGLTPHLVCGGVDLDPLLIPYGISINFS